MNTIFIFKHKDVPYSLPQNELYHTLEVGTACRKQRPEAEYRDNSIADNISKWNAVLAELTGQWWIWRNLGRAEDCGGEFRGEYSGEWIGQTQYRRILNFAPDTDFGSLGDVVACKPLDFGGFTLEEQYSSCHSQRHFRDMEAVLKTRYPEYAESWDKYLKNGHKIYYSNGFVMRREDYCRYSEWLFDLITHLTDAWHCNTPEEVQEKVRRDIAEGKCNSGDGGRPYFYQGQAPVFLSERLLTLYLRHNYEGRIFEHPYALMENSGI